MKTYTIYLINPIDGEVVYRMSYDPKAVYSHDPYQATEFGALIQVSSFPRSKAVFVPWANITHITLEELA